LSDLKRGGEIRGHERIRNSRIKYRSSHRAGTERLASNTKLLKHPHVKVTRVGCSGVMQDVSLMFVTSARDEDRQVLASALRRRLRLLAFRIVVWSNNVDAPSRLFHRRQEPAELTLLRFFDHRQLVNLLSSLP